MAQTISWAVVLAASAAYVCFVGYLLLSHGGVWTWWRDKEMVRLTANTAAAFGAIVAMWWATILFAPVQ